MDAPLQSLGRWTLDKDFRVTAQDKLTLSKQQNEKVWQIWEEQLTRRGVHLFDGTLFEFVQMVGPTETQRHVTEIVGRFVNYREYLASRRDSASVGREIVSLSVSGLTWFGDHAGLGRRSQKVHSYPGRLELFPSGSIEEAFLSPDRSVDFQGQLLKELQEETGIAANRVRTQRALVLVHDTAERVYDICVEIVTDLSKATYTPPHNDEYSEFLFVPRQNLAQFARAHRDELIPTSVAILEAIDYLPGCEIDH